jgi:hypothetical protein
MCSIQSVEGQDRTKKQKKEFSLSSGAKNNPYPLSLRCKSSCSQDSGFSSNPAGLRLCASESLNICLSPLLKPPVFLGLQLAKSIS